MSSAHSPTAHAHSHLVAIGQNHLVYLEFYYPLPVFLLKLSNLNMVYLAFGIVNNLMTHFPGCCVAEAIKVTKVCH